MPNAAWSTKIEGLREHSVLHLNKRLLADYESEDFAEDQIVQRSDALASQVARLWPRAVVKSDDSSDD